MSDGGCIEGYLRAWIGAERSDGIGWAGEGRSEFTSGVVAILIRRPKKYERISSTVWSKLSGLKPTHPFSAKTTCL